jgi:hypothetical protein
MHTHMHMATPEGMVMGAGPEMEARSMEARREWKGTGSGGGRD